MLYLNCYAAMKVIFIKTIKNIRYLHIFWKQDTELYVKKLCGIKGSSKQTYCLYLEDNRTAGLLIRNRNICFFYLGYIFSISKKQDV